MTVRAALTLALALFATPAAAQDTPAPPPPLLNAMFSDHAVLQRGQPVRVWGNAAPRARVTVTLASARRVVRADSAGAWSATLPAMSAGGPYELTARTPGASQTASDVMVGDVYLCSGQSNIEFSVRGALNGAFEASRANDTNIRHMRIEQRAIGEPQTNFANAPPWQVASPETVPGFSAACYFMARELRRTIDVPMGLVTSAWGGSNIRAWVSQPTLRTVGQWNQALDMLALHQRDPLAGEAAWGEMAEAWYARNSSELGQPWRPEVGANWTAAAPSDTWAVAERASFIGALWQRATFTLTAEQAAQDATTALGVIDEADQTWINGRFVGAIGDWTSERNYRIPPGLLHVGENVLVTVSINTSGTGGVRGPANALAIVLADGVRVPLRSWRFFEAPSSASGSPRPPWGGINGYGTLYNGMIAPLGQYGFRGAVWYQGESNAGAPDDYETLMTALMTDWRQRLNAPTLPFLIVQLPNFGMRNTAPVESGWSGVREGQRRAANADPHAALAVTIDVGDAAELHPPNKQAVGRRLARAARAVVYGEDIVPSGPIPASVIRAQGAVLVRFTDIEERLVAYGGDGPIGFELCGDAVGSCRFALARFDGEQTLRLTADNAQTATRVRYCWGDAPTCTLYDSAGAPAGPFEEAIR